MNKTDKRFDEIIKLLKEIKDYLRSISNSVYVEKSHGSGCDDNLPCKSIDCLTCIVRYYCSYSSVKRSNKKRITKRGNKKRID